MRCDRLLVSFLLLSLCACGKDQGAPAPAGTPAPPAPSAESAAAAPQAPASQDPAPIGPMSSSGKVLGSGGGASAQPAGLDFDLPDGWQSEAPATKMRFAQASIPGSGGPGQLAAFYFGPGQGGGVEDNLQRWTGQMKVAEGSQPQRGTFEANGFRITWLDVAGTLLPSGMGMGPTTEQPGSRLLGAVIEGQGGPWFFKVTGPDATIAPQREAFLAMLRSVRAR